MDRYNSGLKERARRFSALFIILGVVALGLQAAGCGTRGWLIMKIAGVHMFIGLWGMRVCVTTVDVCVTHTLDDLESLSGGIWSYTFQEFQVETCLGIAMLVIALVLYVSCAFCSCDHGHVKGCVYAAFAMAIISAIFALIASGKFGNDVKKTHDLFELLGDSPIEVPYSVILTGIGGILSALWALILLCVLKPYQRDIAEPPPSYPMHQSPPAAGYPPPAQQQQQQAYYPQGQPGAAYAVPYSGHHNAGYSSSGEKSGYNPGYGRKY